MCTYGSFRDAISLYLESQKTFSHLSIAELSVLVGSTLGQIVYICH